MPYSYLPQLSYLTVNGGVVEFVHKGKPLTAMTPEEARSNAADLLEAADRAEGSMRGCTACSVALYATDFAGGSEMCGGKGGGRAQGYG